MDLVVKNGTIVTSSDIFKAEIGVKDGKVVTLSKSLSEPAEEVIDANGKLVFPGIIDAHTHLEMLWMGTINPDDFEWGSIAGACGGVTTLIDFAIQKKGHTITEEIEARRKIADPKVCIDYSLHAGVTDLTEATVAEIPKVINDGYPSFKMFMTYRKEGVMVDDEMLFRAISVISRHNGLLGLHAENDGVIYYFTQSLLKQGKKTAAYFHLSRPSFAEEEAVKRAIILAEHAEGSLYFFHLSTKAGLAAITEARKRGLDILAETCPQYLLLTDQVYLRKDGRNFICAPPIRTKNDADALWRGVANGDIALVATDHSVSTTQQKKMEETFDRVRVGVPGIETMLPMLYSEGVRKGRISLNRLVGLLCGNPAKVFGMYPQKGTIAIGSDADFTIFDPKKEVTITAEKLHSRNDYSIYEGWKVKGYPEKTISRGDIIFRDGSFCGERGHGRFIPRKPYSRL